MKNIKSLYIFNEQDYSNNFLHNQIRSDFNNLDQKTKTDVKLLLETKSKYNIDENKKDNIFSNKLYDLCNELNNETIIKSDIDVFKIFSNIINNYENTVNKENKKYDFFKDLLAINFKNEKYNNNNDIIVLSSLLQAKYLHKNDENEKKDDYITILKNEVGNEKTDNKIKLINIMKSSKRIVFNDIILIFIITFILIFCFIILSLTLYYSEKENINCSQKYENTSIIWTLDTIKPIYIKICDIVNVIFKRIKDIL
jgi:hypothetical protein